uniref:Haloacid dehalogenase-like hydrolase domain-containing protein n=1 Tax=Ananas comosus var. bracteatus TaxID=296719 RepID=A0A6V7PJK1_ANACO|nr:unnamed protein product [Ananas comosus var. bracteatus]
MDGTLTVPVIDFPAMYREVLGDEAYDAAKRAGGGVRRHPPPHRGVAPAEQRRAYEVIAHFEQQGLDRLQIMPGAQELCEFLDSRRIRRGLITRNVKAAVDLFHQRFAGNFVLISQTSSIAAYLFNLGPSSNEVMMIGDSLKDDIVCGKRAGAFTCLLDEAVRYGSLETVCNDLKPDFKVSSLSEVFSVLETHFDLMQQAEAA